MGTVRKSAIAMALAAFALSGCAPAQGDSTPGGETAEAASPGQAAGGVPSGRARPAPGRAWVIFGADTVVAEVARTPEQRAEGLMYRQELPDGTGMLFVFEENEVRSFWMQNTYVALDIAFLDPGLTVVDIQQMAPMTTDNHDSTSPAMFALEVRQGWFAERGIAVGTRAQVVFGIQ
ncbi:MAG TPA: DUF192 domain-containing protein [Longimicrobiales bacterium]|nr:DUF192 domain-containing protein [Longimicrobiales bacterium]